MKPEYLSEESFICRRITFLPKKLFYHDITSEKKEEILKFHTELRTEKKENKYTK